MRLSMLARLIVALSAAGFFIAIAYRDWWVAAACLWTGVNGLFLCERLAAGEQQSQAEER